MLLNDDVKKDLFFSGNINLVAHTLHEQWNKEPLTSTGNVQSECFPAPEPKEISQGHCQGRFHTSMPKYNENDINQVWI